MTETMLGGLTMPPCSKLLGWRLIDSDPAQGRIKVTVVQPGFFRTDFLDDQSVVRTAQEIADYADTIGKTRDHAAAVNHAQPGDPRKLAKAFITLVNAKEPPTRLQLGSDTVARVEAKHAHVERELRQWRALAISTDHGEEAA